MKQSSCLFVFTMVRYIQIVINTKCMIFLLLLFFFSMVQMPVILGSQLDREKITKNVFENFIKQDKKFEGFKIVEKSIHIFVDNYCEILQKGQKNILKLYPKKEIEDLCENYKTGLGWSESFAENNLIVGSFNTEKEMNNDKHMLEFIHKSNKKDVNEITSEYLLDFFRMAMQNEKNKANQFTLVIKFSLPTKTKEIFEKLTNNNSEDNSEESSSDSNPEPNNTNNSDNIDNKNIKGIDDSDSKEEVVDNTPPLQPISQEKSNKYFIIGKILVALLCFYGIYKYIPLKKILFLQNLIDATQSKCRNIVDAYSNLTIKNKLIDHIDLPESEEEKDEMNGRDQKEEIIKKEKTEEQNVEPQNNDSEKSENQQFIEHFPSIDGQPSPEKTLGGSKQSQFGSMRLLGSSFSATFLLLFAGYLLQNPDQGLKTIEKTPYDTYRTYLRYAVAGVALVASAVLVFGMTQNV